MITNINDFKKLNENTDKNIENIEEAVNVTENETDNDDIIMSQLNDFKQYLKNNNKI
jgi:hypothetical protein